MLQLFAHPFAAYCWKVLIPLYENGTAFEYRPLDPDHPENGAELARRWPMVKFPMLLDGDRAVHEASIIVEYLQLHFPGPVKMIPGDADAALDVRMLDRVFDHHVMHQVQRVVGNAIRPPERQDPVEADEARAMLGKAYGWLEAWLDGREWAAAEMFSLADCAAAPALFYADWVHPIGDAYPNLRAYRARLLARPSVARVVDEARPYRPLFPLGAPDRD